MKNTKYLCISTTKTKDVFTINGCGKFNEDKKHLSKSEASLLYNDLYK